MRKLPGCWNHASSLYAVSAYYTDDAGGLYVPFMFPTLRQNDNFYHIIFVKIDQFLKNGF